MNTLINTIKRLFLKVPQSALSPKRVCSYLTQAISLHLLPCLRAYVYRYWWVCARRFLRCQCTLWKHTGQCELHMHGWIQRRRPYLHRSGWTFYWMFCCQKKCDLPLNNYGHAVEGRLSHNWTLSAGSFSITDKQVNEQPASGSEPGITAWYSCLVLWQWLASSVLHHLRWCRTAYVCSLIEKNSDIQTLHWNWWHTRVLAAKLFSQSTGWKPACVGWHNESLAKQKKLQYHETKINMSF